MRAHSALPGIPGAKAEPAAKSRPKANNEREVPKPSVYEEPKPQVNEEEHGETDEDREALLALIALGGE